MVGLGVVDAVVVVITGAAVRGMAKKWRGET